MNERAVIPIITIALGIHLVWATALEGQQKKVETQERPGNAILMDDDFEYTLLDYGLGQIQVRPLGTKNDLSERAFWVKFRITNKADHLIQRPRYFPSVLNALSVLDNWDNVYWARCPSASDVGGNWHGATLPVPEGEGKDRYKPGEASWSVRIIPAGEFVEGTKELRIYLANQFGQSRSYFKIADPMLRRKNLLQEQSDPEPSELKINVILEKSVPTHRRATRKRKG